MTLNKKNKVGKIYNTTKIVIRIHISLALTDISYG